MSFSEVVHILNFCEDVESVAQAHLEILGLSHPPASKQESYLETGIGQQTQHKDSVRTFYTSAVHTTECSLRVIPSGTRPCHVMAVLVQM